jgi:hypothetical protein
MALQKLLGILTSVRSAARRRGLFDIFEESANNGKQTRESNMLVVFVLGRAGGAQVISHIRNAQLFAKARHANRMGQQLDTRHTKQNGL